MLTAVSFAKHPVDAAEAYTGPVEVTEAETKILMYRGDQ